MGLWREWAPSLSLALFRHNLVASHICNLNPGNETITKLYRLQSPAALLTTGHAHTPLLNGQHVLASQCKTKDTLQCGTCVVAIGLNMLWPQQVPGQGQVWLTKNDCVNPEKQQHMHSRPFSTVRVCVCVPQTVL